MPAYYDKERKSWGVQFRYTDWTGTRKKKHKRGFKLKREAEEWEREFLLRNAGDPDMTFASLVTRYYADMENHIRGSTLETKISNIDTYILPYFKDKAISDITNADVRQWQNVMLKKRKKMVSHTSPPIFGPSTASCRLSSILPLSISGCKATRAPA